MYVFKQYTMSCAFFLLANADQRLYVLGEKRLFHYKREKAPCQHLTFLFTFIIFLKSHIIHSEIM